MVECVGTKKYVCTRGGEPAARVTIECGTRQNFPSQN